MNFEPGDLVRAFSRGAEPWRHELIVDVPYPERIYIVHEVHLESDPLGPTGRLIVVIVDPSNGEKYSVDGNCLERVSP